LALIRRVPLPELDARCSSQVPIAGIDRELSRPESPGARTSALAALYWLRRTL
jgi:hypothetical protein